MARVALLLRYQWRAYWRGLRGRGAVAGANFWTVLVLALLGLPGVIAASIVASRAFASGDVRIGALVVEALLVAVLAGWLTLPLLVASAETRTSEVSPQRLLHFPLSVSELLLFTFGATLQKPLYWILIVHAAVAVAPLLAAPHPFAGVVGGILFALGAALVSWMVSLIGDGVFRSRRARDISTLVVSLLFFGVLLLDLDVDRVDGDFLLSGIGDEPVLLIDKEGTAGLLVKVQSWTPAAWAVRAGVEANPLPWLGALVATCFVAVAGCHWGLRRALTHPATGGSRPGSRRRGMRTIPGLPAAIGAATLKECRYLSRTLDMILGTLLCWGAAVWLLLQSEPSAFALLAGIGALVSETAMPMNAFGLDRGAVDRYRILPLSGREVLLSKNLAFLIVVAIQVVPLCLAAAFAFGPAESLACLFGFATFALALLMLGNGLSVSEPMPREFFNFDSKEQTGGILGLLYAALIWVVPAGVGLLAQLGGPVVLVGAEALLLGGAILLYRRTLTAAGHLFETSAETMRARLAR